MLGQWVPRFPADPGRAMPYDPISTELARRIQWLNDELGRASNACTYAIQRYQELSRTRVGLAPALFEDPVLRSDPALDRAYMDTWRFCDQAEDLAAELNRLRQMLRQRAARRMTATRVAPVLRSVGIPFMGQAGPITSARDIMRRTAALPDLEFEPPPHYGAAPGGYVPPPPLTRQEALDLEGEELMREIEKFRGELWWGEVEGPTAGRRLPALPLYPAGGGMAFTGV